MGRVAIPQTGYKPGFRRNPLTGALVQTILPGHHGESAYNRCMAPKLRGRAGSVEAQAAKMAGASSACRGAARGVRRVSRVREIA